MLASGKKRKRLNAIIKDYPKTEAATNKGWFLATITIGRFTFPKGANDYDNVTSRILSAASSDGVTWIADSGVRLTRQAGCAGDFRVVSAEVVPTPDDDGLT